MPIWIGIGIGISIGTFLALYGYLQNLDSGLWTGPWTHNYSGSDQLISLLYYCLADLHSFLIPDMLHLNNNIYDTRLMKSFHGADTDDDSN